MSKKDPEVNYEALLEAALNKMKGILDAEKEYFDMLARVNTLQNDITIVCSHLMEMSMADQVQILKAVVLQGEIAKALQAKYKFEEEI